ncbi:MAG: aspartate kinase [Candidatus Brocadiae bacterium]|nr:aspartate kinase [Candidatus Brocadiia bacterium]
MIVMKFGGSSISNADRIKSIAKIIQMSLNRKPFIVTSAMGKTTDNLLQAGENALHGTVNLEEIKTLHYDTLKELGLKKEKEKIEDIFKELANLLWGIYLLKELSPRTKDYLVSFGERLSAKILAAYLSKVKIPAQSFDAWDIGFTSNSDFTNGEVLDESYEKISQSLGKLKSDYSYTPVITGFIAKDKSGNITTLGRGGSDLTASVLGAALDVEEIEVWKDVDGILTTDPRIVKHARPVQAISFEEASELAYFGAKVLHPRSIIPAMLKNIPVRVKNFYDFDHPGTVILKDFKDEKSLLRVITFKRNVTLIDVVSTRMLGQYGFMSKVFQIFNDEKISVDMVATSEISISMTLNDYRENLDTLKKELEKIANIEIKKGKSIITMIGNVKHSSEILEQVFNALKAKGINVQMISQGASKVNISFIVDDREMETCVKDLHKIFFEETT